MKRFFSLILVSIIGCFVLHSCSNDDTATLPEGKGSIILNGGDIDLSVNEITRAVTPLVDYDGYTLKIADASTTAFEGAVPAGGIVDNITSGTYTVSLTNMTGFVPAFAAPRYAGQKENVEVKAGEATQVAFNLKQANAGIRFVYDSSIDQYGVVAATVTQGGNTLDYSTNPNATGYFSPGEVTMSFMVGAQVIKIGGQESITRTLAAADMLIMTLRASSDKGKFTLVVSIDDTVNEKTETIGLDPIDVPEEAGFTVVGFENATMTVKFSDDTTVQLTADAEGNVDFTGHEGKTIKSIKKSGAPMEVYIGRRTDEKVVLKMASSIGVAFRDADVDGYIPIGTYAELSNIRNGLTGKYKQEANIDMLNQSIQSIPHNASGLTAYFEGEFDGNGYSLKNLKIAVTTNFAGLFGANKGLIRRVIVESGSVTSSKGSVGGICGHNDTDGIVEFCINKASVTITSGTNCGGIVGRNYGTIRFCGNTGTITGTGNDGGICGDNNKPSAQVIGCYNKADQPCKSNSDGGVVGNNLGTVAACYNIGNMPAESNRMRIAGVVGYNSANVYACYSVGEVTGNVLYIAGAVHNLSGTVKDTYWSGCQTIGAAGTGSAYEVSYFTDGTTAPDGAATGWPTADASKGWGIYTDTYEGGYYWKDLGTSGTTGYPKLWWE